MWCDLPTEILIQIFDYIDPVFLVKTVTTVCKRFKNIISDLSRLNYYQSLCSRCPHIVDVPMLRHMGKMSCSEWKELGARLENVCERWNNPKEVHSFCCSYKSVIDTVHVLKNSSICVVGHKSIELWDVRVNPRIVSTIASAHSGWTSCLDSFESETFFSGGGDSVVKLWKIREHSCENLWSSKRKREVMSISSRQDIVAVATFSPVLSLMDPRSAVVSKYEIHRKAIVNVKILGNYVLTISRDRFLNMFDLRMMRTVEKSLIMGNFEWPTCLAAKNNIVYIGDTNGYVHLLHKTQLFYEFQRIPVAARNVVIASIYPDEATFICGGSDRTLRVVAPSRKHFVIKEIKEEHGITSMSFENEILAVGKTNGYVDVYKPGRNCDDSEDTSAQNV